MSRRLLSSVDNHFGKLLIELLLKRLAIRILCGNWILPAFHLFLGLIKVAANLLVHLFPDDLGAFAPWSGYRIHIRWLAQPSLCFLLLYLALKMHSHLWKVGTRRRFAMHRALQLLLLPLLWLHRSVGRAWGLLLVHWFTIHWFMMHWLKIILSAGQVKLRLLDDVKVLVHRTVPVEVLLLDLLLEVIVVAQCAPGGGSDSGWLVAVHVDFLRWCCQSIEQGRAVLDILEFYDRFTELQSRAVEANLIVVFQYFVDIKALITEIVVLAILHHL